jgi:hypothetical protein
VFWRSSSIPIIDSKNIQMVYLETFKKAKVITTHDVENTASYVGVNIKIITVTHF